jgi:LysM repeat protein
MNETTNLNSELLSADARGKKHIPFAVFAVIVIHIVLFLFLLIAAGCRAKARARKNVAPVQEMLAQQQPAPAAAAVTNMAPAVIEPVLVTEPPAEKPAPSPAARKAVQHASPRPNQRPTASAAGTKAKIYVVKAGDTMEKIAKMHRTSVEAIKTENKLKNHLLRPGQQLRVGTQSQRKGNEV